MRWLTWIITIPISLLAVSFAVSNLTPVTLALWPLPWQLVVPAYALGLVPLLAGFLLGGAVTWLGGFRQRKLAKVARLQIQTLERDRDAVGQRASQAEGRLAAVTAAAISPLPVADGAAAR
jgi:lipopolysaccharide assembly protein A